MTGMTFRRKADEGYVSTSAVGDLKVDGCSERWRWRWSYWAMSSIGSVGESEVACLTRGKHCDISMEPAAASGVEAILRVTI